ncbi:MAG: polysaccharide deacetylase family protein [Desulfovibrionaceae bacterium]|nr:polysaccharide deacetylase family protein [Desulfovibrionaceae bacterium]MBF0515294.1 polysaccharide deacetylase family protein [Desulfovibrionaceae bacterium]
MKLASAISGYPPLPGLSSGSALRPGRIFRLIACLALALIAAARPAPAAAEQNAGLTFGSKAVLEALWPPAALAGAEAEKAGKRLESADLAPPARTEPQHALPVLPPGLRGSIRRVDAGGKKLVALTFDLCELADNAAGYDGAVVDALRREQVPATFFAGGKWLRSHSERAMQLICDPLFEIGNHAWTHGNFGVLDATRMREQVLWTQAQYESLREQIAARAMEKGVSPQEIAAIPALPRVFRFPYGRCRPEALELLAGLGLAAVQWDANSQDAGGGDGDSVAARVLAHARPGSIVLCHANGFGHGTAQALPRIIAALRGQGYTFVTVSQLLAQGRAEAKTECYADKPGDTVMYDTMFGDGTRHPKKK